MANTGNKQAVIAYKTRSTDGAPLDINGKPTSETGRKQAIALLAGRPNPNGALYEVEFYFSADAEVFGEPSVTFEPACGIGRISVAPEQLLFEPSNASQLFRITSSDPWTLSATDTALAGIFSFSETSGGSGVMDIKVALALPNKVGQGYITFTNTGGATARLYMINVLTKPWILETGLWNMLGFWQNAGLWKTV